MLKTTHSHLLPLQQHLHNGLAHPADYFIFAHEWTRPLPVSPCRHRNGLPCTENVLGYGHRGWPTSWPAWLTMLPRDRQRVDQGENIMVPLQVLLHAACRGIIINYITTKMSLLIEITQNISKRASNKKWPPCFGPPCNVA